MATNTITIKANVETTLFGFNYHQTGAGNEIDILALSERHRRALEAFQGGYIRLGKLAEEMGMNVWEFREWLYEHDIYKEMINFLGKGESSCIAYAKDRNAIVATDDRIARKQCANMKIPVTGTIGILKASVQDSLLDPEQANEVLANMITAGFYSPVNDIKDIL